MVIRLKLDQEIPVWITIGEDQRLVLIGTNLKQIYKIILPELNSRTLLQGSEHLDLCAVTARYFMKPYIDEGKVCPMFLGKDVWYNVMGDYHGMITLWTTKSELYDNCGTVLRGHVGRISALYTSKSHESLYSVGLLDETILQWRCKRL